MTIYPTEKKKKLLLLNYKNNLKRGIYHGLITSKITKAYKPLEEVLHIKCTKKNSNNHGYTNLNKYRNISTLVINAAELRQEFKDNETPLSELANKLKKNMKIKSLVVTMGKDGALYTDDKKSFICPPFAKRVVDKIGSGDSMLAILAICNYIKLDPEVSMYISSLAAADSVETISNSSTITIQKF